MRIAVVEDEKHWRDEVVCRLRNHPEIEISELDVYQSGLEFLKQNKKYELVFMDIEMPQMDGFETAKEYRRMSSDSILVILTTHTEVSRKGYLVNAFRYIDKCQMETELEEALAAVRKLLSREHSIKVNVVNIGEINLRVGEIFYIETEKRNVRIHTKKADYISSQGMGELERQLGDYGFFRSHKSYLVNLDEIKSFDRQNIYLQNGDIVLISMRKYAELKKRYLERKFEYANM